MAHYGSPRPGGLGRPLHAELLSVQWYSSWRMIRRSSRADPVLYSPEAREMLRKKRNSNRGPAITDKEITSLYELLTRSDKAKKSQDMPFAPESQEPSKRVMSERDRAAGLEDTAAEPAQETLLAASDPKEQGPSEEVGHSEGDARDRHSATNHSESKHFAIVNTRSPRASQTALYKLYGSVDTSELLELQARNSRAVKEGEEDGGGDSSPLDVETFNRVIDANAKLGRVEEAEKTLLLLRESGATPNIKTYSLMINVYGSQGDLSKAVEMFKEIERCGLEPSVYSYGSLIKAYVRNNRLEDAFRTYELMKKRETWPSEVVYNTLIKGCLEARDYKRAWGVFEHLKYEIAHLSPYSYTLMIDVCAKSGEAERALNLFDEMVANNIAPNDITCNSLINACAREPRYFDQAFMLLEQMESLGFALDYYTYNTLIYSCSKNRQLRLARNLFTKLFKQVKTDDSGLLKIDEVTYTNLLLSLANHLPCVKPLGRKEATDPAAAERRRQSRVARSVETTAVVTVGDLPLLPQCPSTYAEVVAEAGLLYNRFVEEIYDHHSCSDSYSRLLLAYIGVLKNSGYFEEAWNVYTSEFARLGIKRSGWTYHLALELCDYMRDIDKARQVWDEYKEWQTVTEGIIQLRSLGESTEAEIEKAYRQQKEYVHIGADSTIPTINDNPSQQQQQQQRQQSERGRQQCKEKQDSSADVASEPMALAVQQTQAPATLNPQVVAKVADRAVIPNFAKDQTTSMTPREQRAVRAKIGRDEAIEYMMYARMAKVLAKCNQLDQSLEIIDELKNRIPYYEHNPALKDFTTVYSRAVQTENIVAQNKLLSLCHPRINQTMKRIRRKWGTPMPFDVGKQKRASIKYQAQSITVQQ
ncbi:hypothetical protein EV182_001554 [Spiromyces aspiralis]|uniref:Uncharacterized protein n=1 Tax=Spiromyces aspiralis TaxID=68401 RepID=A0ACC1HHS5_9FUNG|nr:hypothetical protein EV182_001554 [Spiromyces aspiralis]